MTAWVCGLPAGADWDSHDKDEVQAVVVAAQTGDADAFAELYRRYYQRIYVWLRARVSNDSDAEDLVQEVFLTAMSLIDTYQPRAGKPIVAWLYALGKGRLEDHNRRCWTHRQSVEGETDRLWRGAGDERAGQDPATTGLSEAVTAALNQLPPAQQQCMRMRYVEGLPAATTAMVNGWTENAVSEKCRKAVRRLRRELAELAPARRQPTPPPAGVVLYTVPDAAAQCGRSSAGLHQAIREQRLTAYWVEGRLMVTADDLGAYLATARPTRRPLEQGEIRVTNGDRHALAATAA